MKNKNVLMAAVLAVATVLSAGLTVLPSTVQEAQANPCATEFELDVEGDGDVAAASDSADDDRECDFTGPVRGLEVKNKPHSSFFSFQLVF
jgi:hypothetical protein